MSNVIGSLDTNVLLRIIIRSDESQYAAAKKLIKVVGAQYAVSDVVLIETAFVLEKGYKLDREEVHMALRGIMSFRQINCNRIMFDRALDLYSRFSGLSLEDCVIVTYAELNDALPLYTFDKKLAKSSPYAKLLS